MNQPTNFILIFLGFILIVMAVNPSGKPESETATNTIPCNKVSTTSKDESESGNTTTAYSQIEDTTFFQNEIAVSHLHLDAGTAESIVTANETDTDSPETMEPIEMLWYIIKMTSIVGTFICGLLLCHRSMKEKGQGKTTGIFFGLLGFVVLAIVLIGSTFPSFAEYEYFPNICWAALFAILLVCTIISHRRDPNWPSMFIEEQNNDHNGRHPKDTRTR